MGFYLSQCDRRTPQSCLQYCCGVCLPTMEQLLVFSHDFICTGVVLWCTVNVHSLVVFSDTTEKQTNKQHIYNFWHHLRLSSRCLLCYNHDELSRNLVMLGLPAAMETLLGVFSDSDTMYLFCNPPFIWDSLFWGVFFWCFVKQFSRWSLCLLSMFLQTLSSCIYNFIWPIVSMLGESAE